MPVGAEDGAFVWRNVTKSFNLKSTVIENSPLMVPLRSDLYMGGLLGSPNVLMSVHPSSVTAVEYPQQPVAMS